MVTLNSILRRDNLWDDVVNQLSKTNFDLPRFNTQTLVKDVDGVRNIYAEVPGCAKEDINITVKNNILNVKGHRKVANIFGEKAIELRFELPNGKIKYDLKGITASVENGILHIQVPYEKPTEPEEITIKVK